MSTFLPGDRVVVRGSRHNRARPDFLATFLRYLPKRVGPRMALVGDTIPDDPAPVRVYVGRLSPAPR